MFNLSPPAKHSKERRKRLPISQAISPLKVAGEEHCATAVRLRRPAEAKKWRFIAEWLKVRPQFYKHNAMGSYLL